MSWPLHVGADVPACADGRAGDAAVRQELLPGAFRPVWIQYWCPSPRISSRVIGRRFSARQAYQI